MIENLQGKFYQLEKYNEKVLRCMFLSWHVRVSEWIHTL